MFNVDGCELNGEGSDTPEGFLSHRLEAVANSKGTVISFCVMMADTPMYDDARGGMLEHLPDIPHIVKALIRPGRCPLQIVLLRCERPVHPVLRVPEPRSEGNSQLVDNPGRRYRECQRRHLPDHRHASKKTKRGESPPPALNTHRFASAMS